VSDFSVRWLALREPADRAARNERLAKRFAAGLRSRRIFDLGAGTGANARYLAPLIAGDQEWVLVERDRALRAAQKSAFRAWARRNRYRYAEAARAIVIETDRARWRFRTLAADLTPGCERLPLRAGDGVTAAAFFDLVSDRWLTRFVAWLKAHQAFFLGALTVDGRRLWRPALGADALVELAFRRDQARDKGFGPALGAKAAEALPRTLRAAGFAVATAAGNWRLGTAEHALSVAMARADARLARTAWPQRKDMIDAWRRRRLKDATMGRLALTVGHRCVLALPRGI
jgi:SAM-dependent methyltransferase